MSDAKISVHLFLCRMIGFNPTHLWDLQCDSIISHEPIFNFSLCIRCIRCILHISSQYQVPERYYWQKNELNVTEVCVYLIAKLVQFCWFDQRNRFEVSSFIIKNLVKITHCFNYVHIESYGARWDYRSFAQCISCVTLNQTLPELGLRFTIVVVF